MMCAMNDKREGSSDASGSSDSKLKPHVTWLMDALKQWTTRGVYLALVPFVLAIGLVLYAIGRGERLNLGGILGTLLKGDSKSNVERANEVPADRVATLEESGSEDFKQQRVDVLKGNQEIFRDKSKLKIRLDDGKTRVLSLPKGVQDHDVQTVYRADPDTYRIKVKSTPDQKPIDDLLNDLQS